MHSFFKALTMLLLYKEDKFKFINHAGGARDEKNMWEGAGNILLLHWFTPNCGVQVSIIIFFKLLSDSLTSSNRPMYNKSSKVCTLFTI